MSTRFTLEYWEDEGWFAGKLKEVPGIFSQGEILNALIENIQEAYQLMMEESETKLMLSPAQGTMELKLCQSN